MNLYTDKSCTAKYNAQANLEGRTHYVDDDTLRFHKSRILNTTITDGGLLFALVESYSVDPDGRQRAFRPVIFDVFGTTIHRPELGEGFSTSKKAVAAMWDVLNDIDAIAVTEVAMGRHLEGVKRELQYLRDDIAKIKGKAA